MTGRFYKTDNIRWNSGRFPAQARTLNTASDLDLHCLSFIQLFLTRHKAHEVKRACSKLLDKHSKELTLSTLGKFSADDILKYISYFSQKTELNMSCKLCPLETICMTCQILFSGKIRKKYNYFVVCWISPESGKDWGVPNTIFCNNEQRT